MSHELLVYLAKTVGLVWMMGFFVIAAIWAYSPRRRQAYEHAARSILADRDAPSDPRRDSEAQP